MSDCGPSQPIRLTVLGISAPLYEDLSRLLQTHSVASNKTLPIFLLNAIFIMLLHIALKYLFILQFTVAHVITLC